MVLLWWHGNVGLAQGGSNRGRCQLFPDDNTTKLLRLDLPSDIMLFRLVSFVMLGWHFYSLNSTRLIHQVKKLIKNKLKSFVEGLHGPILECLHYNDGLDSFNCLATLLS